MMTIYSFSCWWHTCNKLMFMWQNVLYNTLCFIDWSFMLFWWCHDAWRKGHRPQPLNTLWYMWLFINIEHRWYVGLRRLSQTTEIHSINTGTKSLTETDRNIRAHICTYTLTHTNVYTYIYTHIIDQYNWLRIKHYLCTKCGI